MGTTFSRAFKLAQEAITFLEERKDPEFEFQGTYCSYEKGKDVKGKKPKKALKTSAQTRERGLISDKSSLFSTKIR